MNLETKLISILKSSPILESFFSKADIINLKNWYIAGGSITQTVWNHLLEKDPLHGIRDLDIVYFDQSMSLDDDRIAREGLNFSFKDLGYELDVQSQANVHFWYEDKFGDKINPYSSVDEGISRELPIWPG